MANYPIYSKVLGRDTGLTLVSEVPTDWFGIWLSQHEPANRPATFRDILTKVLPKQTWVPFVVGDGSYLNYSEENKHINRRLRFTIVSTPESPKMKLGFPPDAPVGDIDHIVADAFHGSNQTVCVVGSFLFDDHRAFLQVASWDVTKRQLKFYQRDGTGYDDSTAPTKDVDEVEGKTSPKWLYLGASADAFTPDTEGRGPFCGHVNGTLVMKELSVPWRNWHSTRHQINATFSLDDPLLQDRLLQPPGGQLTYVAMGDRFEQIVKNATREWYYYRRANDFGSVGQPHKLPNNIVSWMRHVLTTTTINIAGSQHNTPLILEELQDTRIPSGFFFSHTTIGNMLSPMVRIPVLPAVRSAFYNVSRIRIGLKTIYDWKNMGVAFDHEGQTPWCVIIQGLEDWQGINSLQQGTGGPLTDSELLSLLMIDFPNPVYSRRREKLLQYVPATGADFAAGTSSIIGSLRASVSASPAAQDPSSPEYEYLQNIDTPHSTFAERLRSYMEKVIARIQTQDGIDDYMLLAESRRRIFRPFPSSTGSDTNPLSEFSKSLPYATNIPKDWKYVEMTEDAHVRVMDEEGQRFVEKKIAERYKDTPRRCHTVDTEAGCPY